MGTIKVCPECGSVWQDENTCQEHFHQMLFWEWENPGYGEVHHLMVLCYHLQHPSLYSPEGLRGAMNLLEEFVERGTTTESMRTRNRTALDSSKRTWKIKGTPVSHGVYEYPISWTMTAADVITNGVEHYCDSVRTWAKSINEALKASGNFATE